MARMLGSIPPTQECPYGCCTKWGPNRKLKRTVKRMNKHRERQKVQKEIRDERVQDESE